MKCVKALKRWTNRFALLFIFASQYAHSDESAEVISFTLSAFATDGCSDFPDGTLGQKTLWLNCCVEHDVAYWLGGSYQQRVEADDALESCVAAIGEPEIAAIMLAGVRVGGSPYWPTRYRWGYGWPYWQGMMPRGYKVLTETEKQQVKALSLDAENPSQ